MFFRDLKQKYALDVMYCQYEPGNVLIKLT